MELDYYDNSLVELQNYFLKWLNVINFFVSFILEFSMSSCIIKENNKGETYGLFIKY